MSHCSRKHVWTCRGGGNLSLVFSHVLGENLGGWGGMFRVILGEWSGKIFNRSPITLKFGGRKLERESQERESESEIESERVVVIFLLVSCYSIFVSLAFYPCNLLFYL